VAAEGGIVRGLLTFKLLVAKIFVREHRKQLHLKPEKHTTRKLETTQTRSTDVVTTTSVKRKRVKKLALR
jgi:hypothetical protein